MLPSDRTLAQPPEGPAVTITIRTGAVADDKNRALLSPSVFADLLPDSPPQLPTHAFGENTQDSPHFVQKERAKPRSATRGIVCSSQRTRKVFPVAPSSPVPRGRVSSPGTGRGARGARLLPVPGAAGGLRWAQEGTRPSDPGARLLGGDHPRPLPRAPPPPARTAPAHPCVRRRSHRVSDSRPAANPAPRGAAPRPRPRMT